MDHPGYEGKYPKLNHRFESETVPGLYFVGTTMHSHDYKKAAGGFIHGFRYLVRALHRILEQDQEETGSDWPKLVMKTSSDAVDQVVKRLNTAGGPYQMFGQLVDIILFYTPLGSQSPIITYREEVPLKYVLIGVEKWCAKEKTNGGGSRPGGVCSYVQVSLEYGKDHRPIGSRDPFAEDRVGITGETSHFLHPILRSYSPNPDPQQSYLKPFIFVGKEQLSE